MTRFWMVSILIGLVLAISLAGCGGSSSESGEAGDNSENGEHSSGSESGEGGSAATTQRAVSTAAARNPVRTMAKKSPAPSLLLTRPTMKVRAGARLILRYDSTANAFVGTVENTTETTLARVRVEVHLSNGIELGPTTPVNLAPGQISDITLPASSQPFTSWSAHPEVG